MVGKLNCMENDAELDAQWENCFSMNKAPAAMWTGPWGPIGGPFSNLSYFRQF